MPGFRISNVKTNSCLKDMHPEKYIQESLGCGTAQRQTLGKFLNDKAFYESDEYIIIIEGYLLNKNLLFKKYHVSTVEKLVSVLIQTGKEDFFSEFRGCFSGAVYLKMEEKWIVFTNQIGDNPIFYLNSNGIFVAGSEVNYIIDFCKEHEISLSFNESCAYQMLTYGYIASDETYANEIKRLCGGDYLVFQKGQLKVMTYHRFKKHIERFEGKSEEQVIDEIENTFQNAVALEWDKDDEYGYHYLADLSGGLDSRMNIWVSHKMSERHMTVLTYCKEGYLDEIIARQIADYWQDNLIFKPLDDANFLYDIDDNTTMLGGLSLYSGITGGKRLLESIDLSEYGIEHTGMVGDIALGSFFHNVSDSERKWPSGMYSQKLQDRLTDYVKHYDERYFDYEVFLMYARGFHGACNSHLLRRNYTEVGSPFLNVEFMQLCFDIPVDLRIGHSIYKKWIKKYHPDAASFIWEKTGGKITESITRTKIRRIIKKGPQKLLRIVGKDSIINTGMNPLDYWVSHNKQLSDYLYNYEKTGYIILERYASCALIQDMKDLFKHGNANEKTMVLTVLSATKLYFGE